MKTIAEIRRVLLVEGAKIRLLDLNQERDVLLKILNQDVSKHENANNIIKDVKKYKKKSRPGQHKGYKYKKGTHWTQKPENKARLLKMSKAGWKKRKK